MAVFKAYHYYVLKKEHSKCKYINEIIPIVDRLVKDDIYSKYEDKIKGSHLTKGDAWKTE